MGRVSTVPSPATHIVGIPAPPGSGATIHASLLDFQTQYGISSWRGYRYWLAYTPYSSTTGEPIWLAASNSLGSGWTTPSGISNPLHHHAQGTPNDPEVVYDRVRDELLVVHGKFNGMWWYDADQRYENAAAFYHRIPSTVGSAVIGEPYAPVGTFNYDTEQYEPLPGVQPSNAWLGPGIGGGSISLYHDEQYRMHCWVSGNPVAYYYTDDQDFHAADWGTPTPCTYTDEDGGISSALIASYSNHVCVRFNPLFRVWEMCASVKVYAGASDEGLMYAYASEDAPTQFHIPAVAGGGSHFWLPNHDGTWDDKSSYRSTIVSSGEFGTRTLMLGAWGMGSSAPMDYCWFAPVSMSVSIDRVSASSTPAGVVLAWESGAVSGDVQRQLSSGDWSAPTVVGVAGPSTFTDRSVHNGVEYEYRVSGDGGSWFYSPSVSVQLSVGDEAANLESLPPAEALAILNDLGSTEGTPIVLAMSSAWREANLPRKWAQDGLFDPALIGWLWYEDFYVPDIIVLDDSVSSDSSVVNKVISFDVGGSLITLVDQILDVGASTDSASAQTARHQLIGTISSVGVADDTGSIQKVSVKYEFSYADAGAAVDSATIGHATVVLYDIGNYSFTPLGTDVPVNEAGVGTDSATVQTAYIYGVTTSDAGVAADAITIHKFADIRVVADSSVAADAIMVESIGVVEAILADHGYGGDIVIMGAEYIDIGWLEHLPHRTGWQKKDKHDSEWHDGDEIVVNWSVN